MNYYIGLDLGTSGIKGVVFDALGNVIASYLEEYDIISIEKGYAEENPNVWYEKTIEVLKKIGKLDFCKNIKGLALSGQMHGLVLLDENDNALRNSIIWCDNRTDNERDILKNEITDEKLKAITGNIAMSAFTLSKLLWVKNNEPDIYNKIDKVMVPKDYINYKLTSSFCADYSDTSGMQIMDINKMEYSKELLKHFNIPIAWFGKLKESSQIIGYLNKEVEECTGLSNVFVCAGAGDQAAGALGNGIVNSSDLSIVLGSSGVVYSPTDSLYIAPNGEVQSFVTAIKGRYHIMGVTNGCGTSLKWLRDNLFNKGYNEMMDLAANVKCGANGLYYLPYLMGERTPILDSNAKGVFIGIKNTTSKGELIRAVIEGVGYSIKDCYNLINDEKSKVLISGGGAKSLLYKKIIASMINKPLIQIKQDEGPALGAAMLAMLANGEYKDFDECISKIITVDNITYPVAEWVDAYDNGYKIYKKLYLNNKDIFKEI